MKKVFNKILSGNVAIAPDETGCALIKSWRPDEDVYILGVEMSMALPTHDAGAHYCEYHEELNQAGDTGQEPTVARLSGEHSGTQAQGGAALKDIVIMFPEGYGFRVTEDSVLNLFLAYKKTGGAGTCTISCYAYIWYVPARNVK